MSFDFSTLITDRTYADVSRVKELASKIRSGTASESELTEFNSAAMKGAYNYTDLNRVTAAMEALKAKLEGYGYAVPGYQRIKVPHVLPEPEPTSRLPEGYTELTYIESTGTQYIDTEFKPSWNSRVVVDVSGIPTKNSMLFGCRNSADSNAKQQFNIYRSSSTAMRSDYFGTNASFSISDTTGRTVIDKNRNVVTMYGSTVTNTAVSSGTVDYNMFLFGLNNVGTASSFISCKLYSCQIYDNGTLVRDYVPCVNPAGAVGLYDLVTAAFFGNSGTGGFKAGSFSGQLPKGYAHLEYIASTGTQYIDTGVTGGTNASFEMTARMVSTNSINNNQSFGTIKNFCSVNGTSSAMRIEDANGKMYQFTSNPMEKWTVSVESDGKIYFNDAYVNTSSVTAGRGWGGSTYGNWIFYTSDDGVRFATSMELYELKMYTSGVVVRFFVPCKDSSGVCGLYDVANNVFYQNAGSGSFAAGEEIVNPVAAAVSIASVINETEYDPHTWYEFDWPTPETITLYLLNVAAIRSVLAVLKSTPRAPLDAVGFMVQEANDIEVILLDVYAQLLIMPTTFVACGEAICGGDNL